MCDKRCQTSFYSKCTHTHTITHLGCECNIQRNHKKLERQRQTTFIFNFWQFLVNPMFNSYLLLVIVDKATKKRRFKLYWFRRRRILTDLNRAASNTAQIAAERVKLGTECRVHVRRRGHDSRSRCVDPLCWFSAFFYFFISLWLEFAFFLNSAFSPHSAPRSLSLSVRVSPTVFSLSVSFL